MLNRLRSFTTAIKSPVSVCNRLSIQVIAQLDKTRPFLPFVRYSLLFFFYFYFVLFKVPLCQPERIPQAQPTHSHIRHQLLALYHFTSKREEEEEKKVLHFLLDTTQVSSQNKHRRPSFIFVIFILLGRWLAGRKMADSYPIAFIAFVRSPNSWFSLS